MDEEDDFGYYDEGYDDDDEIVIVCPDDMCRGEFDGEYPPCGNWDCVRFVKK